MNIYEQRANGNVAGGEKICVDDVVVEANDKEYVRALAEYYYRQLAEHVDSERTRERQ